MNTWKHILSVSLILIIGSIASGGMLSLAEAMGTAFTYQGRLTNNGSAISNTCDLRFALYNAASAGAQIGSTVTKTGVTVANGLFSTTIDFGTGAFDGNARWLEIGAKCGTEASYTTLIPRQELTPAPYAIYAANQSVSGVFENHSSIVRNTGAHASDDFVFGAPQLNVNSGDTDFKARFLFDKSKAAFRAGWTAYDTDWSEPNTGDYSVAMGYDTQAKGTASAALGWDTTATGEYATAAGRDTIAAGDTSTALGRGSRGNGAYSTAMGYYSYANGDASTALGQSTIANSYAEVAFGLHNTDATPQSQTAWNSSDRLFVIGNGQDGAHQSDALVMLKNGNTSLKGQLTLTNGSSSYTLPNTDGADGQMLQTNGSGTAHWANAPVTFENYSGVVRNTGNHASDDFVFGSPQLAYDGDDYHSSRMFFDKSKGAFRAGIAYTNEWDDANVGEGSIVLGMYSSASGPDSTALGRNATASSRGATALGNGTRASGKYALALGCNTTANGQYSTAIGPEVTASGEASLATGRLTIASGYNSTAMGYRTIASGSYSTALGERTRAESANETVIGSFDTNYTPLSEMWWQSTDRLLVIGNGQGDSIRSDALVMLKNGNTTLKGQLTLTDGTSAYTLPNTDGGNGQVLQTDGSGNLAWVFTGFPSDLNIKKGFGTVDPRDVLQGLVGIPIQTWTYKDQEPDVRHIGPMAQDFHAAFQVGDTETSISAVDANGVAFAAIQGLYQLVQERDAVVAAQASQIDELQAQIDLLMQRLTALEASQHTPVAAIQAE